MPQPTDDGANSPSTRKTLPDRYIEGTCPICGYDGARGDQCDNCGNQLDPIDLKNPRSRDQRRDAQVRRDRTLHAGPARFTMRSALGWRTRTDWRTNVLKFSRPGRRAATTRDQLGTSTGGCRSPSRGGRTARQADLRLVRRGDRILSASIEWARRIGDDDAWRSGGRTRNALVLLHGQGQHRLPLG